MNIQKLIENNLNVKINFKLIPNIFSSILNLKDKSIFYAQDLDEKILKKINNLRHGILILSKKNIRIKKKITQIESNNPKLFFFDLIREFKIKNIENVSPKVGKNTKIYKNVFIGNNVTIGKNCEIFPGVVIGDNVKIGNNCLIKSNSVIGQKGFGIVQDTRGNLLEIPHIGGVKIKDYVEIGAHNTIAIGTIDDTKIFSYNKFDDHVHVAHNCKIKKNNIFCAGTVIGGSVIIGSSNFFGLNCTIKNKIFIGSNNTIGQAANVVKNIKNKSVFVGNPARKNIY
jgi:acyl-[acyl carrier protein]--UDP-N-acetylglucosamine O-acyltransferase